jgi:predicted NAD/FAD-binding protein
MRIAIVGTGISGLVCAHLLDPEHDVTVFEAGSWIGGHTDTGFIVFNERNYPNFIRLLDRLDVASQPSEMSFSVSSELSGVEYRGTNLNTLYAQRTNLLKPSFGRMLVDILRFNRRARRLVADGGDDAVSLADFIDEGGYSPRFRDEFLVPLGASIWSADPETFLEFPAAAYCRFMDNHGLLELRGLPTWRTVTGGSQQYVKALTARLRKPVRTNAAVTKVVRTVDPDRPLGTAVEVITATHGPETFDAVILAGHSDQSLELLGDPTTAERDILGAIGYQPNLVTLHTDSRLLPQEPRARASWNYHLGAGSGREATLTYWMNNLQSIDSSHDFLVTLNRAEEIDRTTVLAEFEYDHPVFDAAAMAAQRRRTEIQGDRGTFFAGAYWGYGFHEDGVVSALDVCRHFGTGL